MIPLAILTQAVGLGEGYYRRRQIRKIAVAAAVIIACIVMTAMLVGALVISIANTSLQASTSLQISVFLGVGAGLAFGCTMAAIWHLRQVLHSGSIAQAFLDGFFKGK